MDLWYWKPCPGRSGRGLFCLFYLKKDIVHTATKLAVRMLFWTVSKTKYVVHHQLRKEGGSWITTKCFF